MKKCRSCKKPFHPINSLAVVCSIECAKALAPILAEANRKRQERLRRAETRAQRERIKTRGDWLRESQAAFNRFIRARDTGQPCISCGRFHGGQKHAGHYLSVGAHPELRFNRNNCHLQCQPCNAMKSGNLIEYRKNLIQKIGLKEVEKLEGPHPQARYSIDDLKDIKAEYTQLARMLEKYHAGSVA